MNAMTLPDATLPTGAKLTPTQRDNLRMISLTAMAAGWAGLLTCLAGYFFSHDRRFASLVLSGLLLAASLTAVWFLQRRGRNYAALTIFYCAGFLWAAALNFQVSGLGLTSGILWVLLGAAIAWQTLPARPAGILVIASLLSGAPFYFIDVNLEAGSRLAPGFMIQELIIAGGSLAFFLLTLNAVRSLEFGSFAAKIRAFLVVTTLLPLLSVTLLQAISLFDFFNTQANQTLSADASALANRLDARLRNEFTELGKESVSLEVVRFFERPEKNSNLAANLSLRYEDLLSYGFLDIAGNLLLDSSGNSGGNESKTVYFQKAASEQTMYLSEVVHEADSGQAVYFASSPVKDAQGRLLGVIRIKFNAQALQTLVETAGAEFGTDVTALLLDEQGIVLAHNTAPEERYKLIAPPAPDQLAALIQAGRLRQGVGSNNLGLNVLARSLESVEAGTAFTSVVSAQDTESDRVTFAPMRVQPWKVLAARHPSDFLAPAYRQASVLAAILLVVMAAAGFGASLAASLLARPLQSLAEKARELGPLSLKTRQHQDELSLLDAALSESAGQVQGLRQTLEARLAERTADISTLNETNQRRSFQLEIVSRIARATTSMNDLDQLLHEIANKISLAFGFYHVGIFLVSEERDYAVLRAANSPGGQKMLARGHRLKIGREGIVGYVTNTGRPRVALDVGVDAVFYNNPDLPDTRSEIALPLRVGEQIIGALDVQSAQPQAFNAEDLQTLTLLGDQISIAIENARLFDEARAALAQLQFLVHGAGSGWQSITGEKAATGYRYIRGTVEPVLKSDTAGIRAGEVLEIPILLRGEKLGTLKIRRGEQAKWGDAELRMYQAIVDRLAFALENARLFSDARRRANLEKLTSETSAKISSSLQFETIMRTAAEEISRILDGSEVVVQIQPDLQEKPGTGKS